MADEAYYLKEALNNLKTYFDEVEKGIGEKIDAKFAAIEERISKLENK